MLKRPLTAAFNFNIFDLSGRQLDYARSGIEVLEEVVTALKQRNLFPNPMFQIFVDGGVRRASDVLKAVAMGATAVGIGRPFLYACEYCVRERARRGGVGRGTHDPSSLDPPSSGL